MEFMDSMFSFWQGGALDGRARCQGDREGHQRPKELEPSEERYC
jgi:hypothetical protein